MKGILNSLTLADKTLIVGLLIVSLISLPAIHKFKKRGKTLVIESRGKVVYQLNLVQSQTIEVTGAIGKTIVKIEKGAAWVQSSDCLQKICLRMGKISRSGEMVICVPNKVLLRVVGARKGPHDAITE